MSRRGGEAGYGDDDRLPWLETVEEDYRERAPARRILLIAALLVAVAIAAGAGYFWYRQHRNVNGNGELIPAPPGDYKVKPNEPGGMKVEGEGDTVFATSQGNTGNSSINADALPEAPVDGKKVAAKAPTMTGDKSAKVAIPSATASRASAAAPARPLPTRATPASAGAGSVIQLGAFPNEAGANTAWARLSKRFAYLAPLGKSVEKADKDGQAVWRLRVNAGSNGQARELCGKLRVAGEGCFVVN